MRLFAGFAVLAGLLAACGSGGQPGVSATPAASATETSTAAPSTAPTAAPTPTLAPATTPTPKPTPLPAIVITSPQAGAVVHSPLHVTGTANVFEAQFILELRDARTGRVLSSQTVHATSGTGTRGTFDATVTFMVAGKANLVAYDRSAKDGSIIDQVTVPVTLAT